MTLTVGVLGSIVVIQLAVIVLLKIRLETYAIEFIRLKESFEELEDEYKSQDPKIRHEKLLKRLTEYKRDYTLKHKTAPNVVYLNPTDYNEIRTNNMLVSGFEFGEPIYQILGMRVRPLKTKEAKDEIL